MNNYQNRAKSRKLKKTLQNSLNIFKFRSMQISNAEKVVIFWAILSLISLFIPWINEIEWSFSANAFSNLAWKSWISIFIIIVLLFFIIFSKQKKEKLKMIWNLHFRNYLIWIIGGIFISISSLSSLSYIAWLQTYSSDVIYGQWPIICLVGWIIIAVGGFLLRREENSWIENIFTEEKNENKNTTNKKQRDNMKLPF